MMDAKIPPYSVVAKVKQLAQVKNYNHDILNIPALWQESRGNGIVIGVMDTGLPEHEDLPIARSWSAIAGYEKDENGHSTHVTGLISGRDNNRGIVGIAPECTINNYTVLNRDGTGSINGIIEAVYRAIEDQCDIINMSFGFGSWDMTALADVCEEAAREGIIIVAAAGNDNGEINQPAAYDFVIAIGAVDQKKERAGFSNHGPELDFAVGGVDVYSTYLDNGYAKMSGTSMACPVFAGICALILGAHRAREQQGDTPGTPINGVQDMVEHIKRFAYDLGPEGWDEAYGYGMPVFIGPDEELVPAPKLVTLQAIDAIMAKLAAVRQAVKELEDGQA